MYFKCFEYRVAHYHFPKIAVESGGKCQVHLEMSSLLDSLHYFNYIVYITYCDII